MSEISLEDEIESIEVICDKGEKCKLILNIKKRDGRREVVTLFSSIEVERIEDEKEYKYTFKCESGG